mgnify:CR=1 FL=1
MVRSCLVPSNRLVSLSGGCPILQVHTFEDGILSELLFNPKHGLLNLPLPSVLSLILRLLLLPRHIVGEKIQLLGLVLLGRFIFTKQAIGTDAETYRRSSPSPLHAWGSFVRSDPW